MLVGLLYSAVLTGLVFARFARPRDLFLCSSIATIIDEGETRSLMVRAVPLRDAPIIDVNARLYWIGDRDPGAADRRHVTEMSLVEEAQPFMPPSWTLVHIVEPGSALAHALESPTFQMVVHLTGTYSLLGTGATGGHVYTARDLRRGHRFAKMIREEDGDLILDVARLNDTDPL